ncbi:hypothetical protein IF1G_06105 [Cordyceps javanica]|uniref:Uncharacterized protein n=1 Tax=Cordyceps javanica TaxID=43265 RepID=A0A545V080_9HYPO|nr:hypothetical protein IF1G_06105 [Cordyceps javanica]TQW05678.1 hypothetical protein IF2G_06800 [Cordyceps javanica]
MNEPSSKPEVPKGLGVDEKPKHSAKRKPDEKHSEKPEVKNVFGLGTAPKQYRVFRISKSEIGEKNQKLHIWIETPDKTCAGFLVEFRLNSKGAVECNMREKSHALDTRGAKRLGYLKQSFMNANKADKADKADEDDEDDEDEKPWWEPIRAWIDCKKPLGVIVGDIMSGLKSLDVFSSCRLENRDESMDDTDLLEYPMFQALWRTKHNNDDALAIEWPGAPILLFLYRCSSAVEFEEVRELTVQETAAEHTVVVGWFFQMDREQVQHICKSEKPPTDAESAADWARGVAGLLLEKQIVFWKGDSRMELISFGALDETTISEPAVVVGGHTVVSEHNAGEPGPASETEFDGDEITYESCSDFGSEDMEIEWF